VVIVRYGAGQASWVVRIIYAGIAGRGGMAKKVDLAFPATDWFALFTDDTLLPVVSWMVTVAKQEEDDDLIWGLVWDHGSAEFVTAETLPGFSSYIYSRFPRLDTRRVDEQQLAEYIRDRYGVEKKDLDALVNTEVVHDLARVYACQIVNSLLTEDAE